MTDRTEDKGLHKSLICDPDLMTIVCVFTDSVRSFYSPRRRDDEPGTNVQGVKIQNRQMPAVVSSRCTRQAVRPHGGQFPPTRTAHDFFIIGRHRKCNTLGESWPKARYKSDTTRADNNSHSHRVVSDTSEGPQVLYASNSTILSVSVMYRRTSS
jgi:hypothetical protein